MKVKDAEKRLLEMQQEYAKAPADQQPRIRKAYIDLHRRWVAAKSQLTLGRTA